MCLCQNHEIFQNNGPSVNAEIFNPANKDRNTRRLKFSLNRPFRKSNTGQTSLSYLGPKILINLLSALKSTSNIHTFKHKIKYNLFQNIIKKEDGINDGGNKVSWTF